MFVGILQERKAICSKTYMLFQDNSDTKTWKGTYLNYKKPALAEQLAFLSVKHSVYLAELFEAIVKARSTGEAICEELKIQYRGSGFQRRYRSFGRHNEGER